MSKFQTIAQLINDALIEGTRADGSKYVHLKDDSPEWMTDIMHAAHGDMMPDDVRYKMIRELVGELVDEGADSEDDISTGEIVDRLVDVYNSDLIAWLSSHGLRTGYCDEAQRDGFVPDDAGLMDRIKWGQQFEYMEILLQLCNAIQSAADDDVIPDEDDGQDD